MAAINSVIHTNRHSIDRVLGAGVPVLLLFARGDLPLPSDLAVALDDAAAAWTGRLLVARVSAGEEPDLVRRYGVGMTPAMVVVRVGAAEETVDSVTAADVGAWSRYLVGSGPRPAGRKSAASPPGSASPAGSATPHGSSATGDPVVLTDATFEAVVGGPLPVLVDFWAPWCGPCRMVAPSVERLAREYAGRAVVAKLNVDENPRTAERFQVRGIPTLLIFAGGRPVDQIVGVQPYDLLNQHLARFVA